ncbi:MAG: DUF2993 domain-containing protein [Firmicutes bacterium]|nr:DUF2993 domain-containing protein [Bacillota bacterium]
MRKRSVNIYMVSALGAVLLYSLLLYGGTVYLQQLAADGLLRSTGASRVEVELRPELPLGLLTGNFSSARLVLEDAVLGPINSERVIVNASGLNVAVLQLLTGGQFVLEEAGEVSARLDLTEENLNAYFDTLSLPKGLVKAEIASDSFQLTGEIPIAGRELTISLLAKLEVLPSNYLQILPQRLLVQNAEMPPILVERLLADYLVIPVDLSALPVELALTGIDLKEGQVSVYAEHQGE